MKTIFKALALSAAVLTGGTLAHADESTFLRTLDGNWRGKGEVRIRTNRNPINVTCDFTSGGKGAALMLDGRCRGLIVVSRKISADLKARGNNYSGAYVGAGTGTAGLNGKRRGDTISLAVRWAKEVNGDRQAQMRIEKLNQNAMRLTTTDKDPKTGRSVITSDITLERK